MAQDDPAFDVDTPTPTISDVLEAVAADRERGRISVADLVAALGDRATAALIFVLAAPNVLPTPPGVSLVLGLPIIVLSVQLMLGRPPRLPPFIGRRSIATRDFARMVAKVLPGIRKAETLLASRIGWAANRHVEPFVGALIALLTTMLFLPVPFGSMLPSLAICMLALGLMEHDGLWIFAGLGTAAAGTLVVSGVVIAIVKGIFAALG